MFLSGRSVWIQTSLFFISINEIAYVIFEFEDMCMPIYNKISVILHEIK